MTDHHSVDTSKESSVIMYVYVYVWVCGGVDQV